VRCSQDGVKDIDRGFTAKGQTPGQAFVDKNTERENVAARLGRLTAKLFRRHVGNCAAGAILR
jgi:hypothetical protein